MRETRVKTADLLAKVRENREKHVKEFHEAVEGYRELALAEVDRAIAELRGQIEGLKKGEYMPLATIYFNLPAPVNHAADYDRVITSLSMCVDEIITIQEHEVAKYVMDDWDWRGQWEETKATYSAVARRK